MNNECPYCGSPSNPGCLCADCARFEESKSAEFEGYCEDTDYSEGDGYASGGWDDGREAFNDPGHFAES